MKPYTFISILLLCLASAIQAQKTMFIGGGYTGSIHSSNGAFVEIGFGKPHSDRFSTLLRGNLGFQLSPDQDQLFAEIHRGYRYLFRGGFFLEQAFGAGAMLSFYTDVPWYEAENGNMGYFPRGRGMDFIPSVLFGAGYAWSNSKGSRQMVWIRPKVYWQIPFQMPSQPSLSLQIGYAHTIIGH